MSDGTSDKAKTYTQFVRFNASTNTYDYAISSRAGYNTWTASDKNLLSYGIRLIVANGATVNNVTFKPMLEIGTVSHEYQPTTLSNPTLKEQIGSALQPESIVNNQTTTKAGFALDARQANPNIDGTLAKQVADLNGSLKINIPLVVKFIDDTKITSQNPKYFADLQSGVFVYFLVCPTGESVFGFSFGENNGSYFGCQILTSGFDMDIKIRNCAWATKWSEWRTL